MLEYSDLSLKLTKEITKDEKKKQGIYFTPPCTVHVNITHIEPYIKNIHSVLEPSCGSGEYIVALNNKFQHLNITGIEKNTTIYDSIKEISSEKINIINEDYLNNNSDLKYDLIIGNPPYFVVEKKTVNKSFYKYFDGRPNIFILFIIKSLNSLNKNGILSFVLPKNFLNCLYYDKTRQYINEQFNIINIIECKDDYIETKQETIIMILQKNNNKQSNKQSNENFTLEINKYLIFGTTHNLTKLKLLYENSTTLSSLDFEVNVGTVVWNQCKFILTNDDTKTRLIYSSDIVNKELVLKKYKNEEKKNFIDKPVKPVKPGETETLPWETATILVINRGYGVGNYNFEYCLIEETKYLVENHLICIKYTKEINNTELIKKYNKIMSSLSNERTKTFIELYFGNNAINTTELNYILPIYDI